jgi:hypothetical protein
MTANRELPHIMVLPEDDANNDIATGFLEKVHFLRQRRIQVLPVAGGWPPVRDSFIKTHNAEMKRWPRRFMVLLVDFDEQLLTRVDAVMAEVDPAVHERVFVLGSLKNPEGLKTAGLGSFNTIGQNLATDCSENTTQTWSHRLLQHNAQELARMNSTLRDILF